MRGSRHNGRAGKNGVYNVKHNDRKFDIEKSEHINDERTKENIYWDCYQGYFIPEHINEEDEMPDSFSEVEARFYEETFSDFCAGQHERNLKNGHTERDRTTEQIRADKRTCPEETIYQLGDMNNHPPKEILVQAAEELFEEMRKKYGEHFNILNWSLHLDETTPHIHERHVFITTNEYGEVVPKQEKALEDMGIPLPDPDKPKGRYNNRKMTFDAKCRQLWLDIVKKHGLDLETEPVYGGRDYLEKNDYIRIKQQERINEQVATIKTQLGEISENAVTLGELKTRIEDTEKIIEEVTDAAYEKAVDAVAVAVQQETHKADLEEIEKHKKWILSPERKAPKETREYAAKRMDGLKERITKSFQTVKARILSLFRKPEKKAEIMRPFRKSLLLDLEEKKQVVKEREAALRLQQSNKIKELEI